MAKEESSVEEKKELERRISALRDLVKNNKNAEIERLRNINVRLSNISAQVATLINEINAVMVQLQANSNALESD